MNSLTGAALPDLLIVIAIICLLFIAGAVFHFAFAEDYIFNMTTDLENESRLLAACIAFDKMDVYIPDCGMLYGGLEGNYGEPIK